MHLDISRLFKPDLPASARRIAFISVTFLCVTFFYAAVSAQDEPETLTAGELESIQQAEQFRIDAIQKVYGAVVAVYGDDRQGGGSGVVYHPSGLALTNHHVIMGAGVSGWAGLADGQLYKWDLIGTDPGGDVAIIKLKGKDAFPFAALGDSDKVHVGDWAMAMGNPFILAEDQTPTVTLGIVSGVKRYQEGAGQNELVYGNCIQVDSSINPGNSGGPLFNMNSEVIGINGRGSFKKRGRVNVGLGYAISVNQIKYFIPELLATKLVEHGTLDASFGTRNGKIVCEQLNLDSPVAEAGLKPGSQLISLEGVKMETVDQFTNLISTLPEDWPTQITFRDADKEISTVVRLYGLPYDNSGGQKAELPKKPTPEQKRQIEKAKQMRKVLTTPAGTIRDEKLNIRNCRRILDEWRRNSLGDEVTATGIRIQDVLKSAGVEVGEQTIMLATDGRFRVDQDRQGKQRSFGFDGNSFWKSNGTTATSLTHLHARLTPEIVQVTALTNVLQDEPFSIFGKVLLDGADKAQNRIAYRIKTLDDRGDWFFVWLSVFDDSGQPNVRLLKASSDKDSDGASGAVTYSDWRSFAGIDIPWQRDFVRGLEESSTLRATTVDVSEIENISDELFRPLEAGTSE